MILVIVVLVVLLIVLVITIIAVAAADIFGVLVVVINLVVVIFVVRAAAGIIVLHVEDRDCLLRHRAQEQDLRVFRSIRQGPLLIAIPMIWKPKISTFGVG